MDEDISNSLQDMTVAASKIANTTFILHDVLSNHTDKVFTLAVHVFNIFVYN